MVDLSIRQYMVPTIYHLKVYNDWLKWIILDALSKLSTFLHQDRVKIWLFHEEVINTDNVF